jgi:hypothetical protein
MEFFKNSHIKINGLTYRCSYFFVMLYVKTAPTFCSPFSELSVSFQGLYAPWALLIYHNYSPVKWSNFDAIDNFHSAIVVFAVKLEYISRSNL